MKKSELASEIQAAIESVGTADRSDFVENGQIDISKLRKNPVVIAAQNRLKELGVTQKMLDDLGFTPASMLLDLS